MGFICIQRKRTAGLVAHVQDRREIDVERRMLGTRLRVMAHLQVHWKRGMPGVFDKGACDAVREEMRQKPGRDATVVVQIPCDGHQRSMPHDRPHDDSRRPARNVIH
jgi:hypothetical protein